jgi:pentatricopeptide repeat protein
MLLPAASASCGLRSQQLLVALGLPPCSNAARCRSRSKPKGVAPSLRFSSSVQHDVEGDGARLQSPSMVLERIKGYTQRSQWKKAQKCFQDYLTHSSTDGLSLELVNGMLDSYCESGRFREATRTLQELERGAYSKDLRADIASYNAVLGALASSGKWYEALQLARRAKLLTVDERLDGNPTAVRPDSLTFRQLIRACGKGGQADQAMELLGLMVEKFRLPLTADVATAAMLAVGKAGTKDGLADAMTIMEDLKNSGAVPTVAIFNAGITACARAGDWRRALALLDEMRDIGLVADSRSFAECMQACSTGGEWQMGMALLNTMTNEGLSPKTIHYNISIAGCNRAGKYSKALQLREEMLERGLKPDLFTLNTALTSCNKIKAAETALELLTDAVASGITPDDLSFRLALSSCTQSGWEVAVKMVALRDAAGLPMDDSSLAAAMRACTLASLPDRAVDLYESALAQPGFHADVSSTVQLIHAHEQQGDWKKAIGAFEALRRAGTAPSAEVVAAAMRACASGQQWKKIAHLYNYASKRPSCMSLEVQSFAAYAFRALSNNPEKLDMVTSSLTGTVNSLVGKTEGSLSSSVPQTVLLLAAKQLAAASENPLALAASLRLVRRLADEGGAPGLASAFAEVIVGFGAAGKHEDVLGLCTEAKEVKLELGGGSVLAAELEAAGQLRDWGRALQVLGTITRSDLDDGDDGAVLCSAARACVLCAKSEQGLKLIKDVSARGIAVPMAVYGKTIAACGERGDEAAAQVIESLVGEARAEASDREELVAVMELALATCRCLENSGAVGRLFQAIAAEQTAATDISVAASASLPS